MHLLVGGSTRGTVRAVGGSGAARLTVHWPPRTYRLGCDLRCERPVKETLMTHPFASWVSLGANHDVASGIAT